jgi:PadR family transcriptional regulator, regulatory protein PadR
MTLNSVLGKFLIANYNVSEKARNNYSPPHPFIYIDYLCNMLTKGLMAASTKPLILTILARGKNYGYDIIQEVKAASGGQLVWADGMLYPVLHKLESEKLIASEWVVKDDRKRKYYKLTDKGRKELVTEKQAWLEVHNTLMRLWDLPESKISIL